MHLLAISLLTILAGTLLLAKFRKDMPGKFFAFISWFFIVVGFILFIGSIGGGICKMTHHGFTGQHDCQSEMMMKDCDHGMKGCCCCPEGMYKEMCSKKPGCMSHDSTMEGCSKHMESCAKHMKGCPKHMEGDSTKMPEPKE
jgi:hypothetical protein